MARTAITTDSGVVVNYEGVPTIPLVIVNEEAGMTYRDQLEIQVPDVYALQDQGYRTTTSCMTPYDMEAFFREQLERHEQLLHLCISDKISAGSNACSNMVAKELAPDRIRVINTRQGGAGGVQVVLRALEAAQQEPDLGRLTEWVDQDLIPRIKTQFIVPDPSGYRRSGKGVMNTFMNIGISAMTSGGGTPLIYMTKSGKMMPYAKLKPGRESRYIAFAKSVLNKRARMEDMRISVATLHPDEAEVQELREWLAAEGFEASFDTMGAIISCYACRNALGISYLQKAR